MRYSDIAAEFTRLIESSLTSEQREALFLEVEDARRRLIASMNQGEELTGIDRVKLENDILLAWLPKDEA